MRKKQLVQTQGRNKHYARRRIISVSACLVIVGALLLGIAVAFSSQKAQATNTGYYGEYWNNPLGPGGQSPSFPGGAPAYTQTDAAINFNWGMGSPDPSIQSEDFVARWTKTTYLAAGTYNFTIRGDDGVRVYVDDNMIIDGWVDQGASTVYNQTYDITAGQHTIKVEFYENGAVAEVYFDYTNQTDTDSDGVANAAEDAAPNSGDANNDGTPDTEQPNVASFVNSVTGKYAALEVPSTCTITSAKVAAEAANTTEDAGFDYPIGLMNFTINCDTPGATAQINQYYFEANSSNKVLRKYNAANHGYQPISGATMAQITIDGKDVSKVTYSVTDGGSLDQDATENSTIVDPAGLAAAVVGAPNTGLGE